MSNGSEIPLARRKRRFPARMLLGAALVLATAGLSLHPGVARAAMLTITVNTTADGNDPTPTDSVCDNGAGLCTLRAAVQTANFQPAGSTTTIIVPRGTYVVVFGPISVGMLTPVGNTVSLLGASPYLTIVKPSAAFPAFVVNDTAIVRGFTIRDGSGPPAIIANNAPLTLASDILTNNLGGAVGAFGFRARLSVTSSTFTNNDATIGAAIDFGGSSGNIQNSTFTYNRASGSGGAIFAGGAQLTVAGSTFFANCAGRTAPGSCLGALASSASGGAFYLGGSNVTARNLIVTNNQAGQGGAFYSTLSLALLNSRIDGNAARAQGGGLYTTGFLASLNGDQFTHNTAGTATVFGQGGAIWNGGMPFNSLNITTTLISANSSTGPIGTGQGGGIYNNATLTANNPVITVNHSGDGGGLYNDSFGVANFTLGQFTSNTATGHGGGIHDVNPFGGISLNYTPVQSNIAGIQTGGIYNPNHVESLFSSPVQANLAPLPCVNTLNPCT